MLILIADDSIVGLESTMSNLQSAGFQVHATSDGKEALDRAIKLKYDAAIFDVVMPILDGVSLLRQVRLLRHWQGVPVILLTATPTTHLPFIEQCTEGLGPTKVLQKPQSFDRVVKELTALIKSSKEDNFNTKSVDSKREPYEESPGSRRQPDNTTGY